MHAGSPEAAPELEAKLSSAVLGFGSSHRVCSVKDEPRSENNRLGIRGACKQAGSTCTFIITTSGAEMGRIIQFRMSFEQRIIGQSLP